MSIGSQEWSGLTLANGRYRIIAKLGEGGMGFVYRALDQNIDAEVVIKVPRQAMMDDPEFAARFTREIRSLVKLSHPHIVKVTDVGTFDGMPFAVMQFLAGGSLEDQRPLSQSGLPLPCEPRSISRWLTAVAQALDYIHTQGYVHRDVKPGNILFDTVGHAFLSDFGVAKVLASSTNAAPSQTAMTGAGMVLGTPEYMAPELIMGEPFDGRVDQYALAITVYELLCGRRPFEDETKTKVLVLHTSKTPSPLTAWCQTLPVRLSQAVLKALAKEPGERYPSCVELAKAVAAAAETTVAQDERIRLKCSSCGKTGSMPVADLARLKAGGGRATCPACKSPIDIGNAVQVAPGPTTGGTMKFSISGSSGEYGLATEQKPPGASGGFSTVGGISGGQAPPRTPQPGRGGTMALSASAAQGPPPLPGEANPPPRRGSGTIIERALPGQNMAAARDVFKDLDVSVPERAGPRKQAQPGEDRTAVAEQTKIWIAAGAGAAAVLLAAAGIGFFMMKPGKDKDQGSPSSTAANQPPPAAKTQTPPKPSTAPVVTASVPKSSPPLGAAGSAPASKVAQDGQPKNQGVPAQASPSPGLASTDQPGAPPIPPMSRPLANVENVAASGAQPPPSRGMFDAERFDTARLAKRARALEYNLQKTHGRAKSYRGDIVVPGGMYCLTRSPADDPAGARKFLATECALVEKGSNKVLELTPLESLELEVDPRLATKLDGMDSDLLAKSLAILTLWINDKGDSGLVRAEILERCEPRLKPGFGIGQADVDYFTLKLSASPQDPKPGKAPDEEWQKPGRMIHFYTHWKHRVDGMRRLRQTMDMAALTNVMGGMYKDAMKGAAIAAAQQGARQHAINGR